ncbi:hypothetical protein TVAG_034370 [Trichomonas vaginalis G3]|uniref:Uncharacterized protein n=1 Tax=Trichomonas vaginalis (strain ATCC PRA-98 / G3) TaxID=412133 RepID=A2EM74_TRIV3|nr:spectrin binding [Trichomonas vaginalis G3]EAY06258.1 hypothetical protein TVAG_034370 [Trichomonas vaginalis G3]KAI5505152.1 spectrin binding [Trichomonas vaginalis G3]|eukprot:XP_001318481.1 hypothetical protein [Trichomonas vaginalis G3]
MILSCAPLTMMQLQDIARTTLTNAIQSQMMNQINYVPMNLFELTISHAIILVKECKRISMTIEACNIFKSANVQNTQANPRVVQLVKAIEMILEAPSTKSIFEMIDSIFKQNAIINEENLNVISENEKLRRKVHKKTEKLEKAEHTINNLSQILSDIQSQEHEELRNRLLFQTREIQEQRDLINRLESEKANNPNNKSSKNSTNQNVKALKKMKKSSKDFDKIYDLISKCVTEKDKEAIKYAIEHEYHQVSKDGSDIMIQAAGSNNFLLCKMLHECGADANSKDSGNWTVLHKFAEKGNIDAIRYFSVFVDVNATNRLNWTPLHYAAFYDFPQIVEYLCSFPQIHVNETDNSGATPLRFAKSDQVKKILRSHGATA